LLQIRSKMAELWPFNWFQDGGRHHRWFLHYVNFDGKSGCGTCFQRLYQIWCESVQKWRSYCHLTDFKIAAAAILNFCTMCILTVNLSAGPHFQPMFQIRCKCVQQWPNYGQKSDYQYGGRRRIGFCWIWVLRVKAVQGPYSQCLYQIWSKSVHRWRSNGRLTDFETVAATILNLLSVSIFIICSSLGSDYGCSCKISYVYLNIRLTC